ncbi:MAG: Crp/Fnr family transcriptional regulator [Rhodospirillaceae bacterium]
MDFRQLFEKDAVFQSFKAGATIFVQGAQGRFMYVVDSGQVDVGRNGRTIYTVPAGSLVGEMALIDHGPRSASAVAKTDCRLIPVDEYRFLVMVQQTPVFALEVMRLLVERLRHMDDRFWR